jgi:hypothetical protein
MNTNSACPVLALNALWYFFEHYWIFFGLASMAIGGFLITAGGRFFKVTMFLAGEFIVVAPGLILMFGYVLPGNSPFWTVTLSLICFLGIGAGVGYAA